jgi:L-arabinose isomerase
MTKNNSLSVGLFSIGLDTYWEQFDGLYDKLLGYHTHIKNRLLKQSADVVDAGLVDTVDKAQQAGKELAQPDVEITFLFISTYALSSTVLTVVQRANNPVVVLNLQPVSSIDYQAFNSIPDRGVKTGEWLAHCQACAAPEIASVFHRAGIDFHLITGYLDDDAAWKDVGDWIEAARAAKTMRDNRVGLLGHYYGGMLDVYSDLTQHSAVFGNHFEIIEASELTSIRENINTKEIKAKVEEFHEKFDVSAECETTELERAAKTSCALDQLVEQKGLGSIAYYFEGVGDAAQEDVATSLIAGNTLLTGLHTPVAGEYEVKNVQAMKILDALNAGGSFSEFYLMDFDDDVVFLGHDGPAHIAIAEGRVGLVPLPVYHGKPGKGLSIQMSVKHGPITILSVVQNAQGELSLLVAEGESVPGEVLHIGNTNSRYKFAIGARHFVNEWSNAGPAHHCAVGVGHVASKLEKLAKLLKIEINHIC